MYEEAIRKADVLIEALGYFRKFHGRFTVIKLGGSVMEDPESLRALLVDIVFMQTVGHAPVVVHGGGKAITVGDGEGRARSPVRPRPALHRRRDAGDRRAGAWPRKSTPTSCGISTSSAAGPRACTTRRTSASSAAS